MRGLGLKEKCIYSFCFLSREKKQQALENPQKSSYDIHIMMKFRDKLYKASEIDFDHLLFSKHDLRKLMIPLMAEQFLTTFMGMADTMMVSRVGSAAISAVSLTDSINVLVIQIFEALAAGGTILCSQYLGTKNRAKANVAARQLLLTVTVISTVLAVICVAFRSPILHLVFGQVEDAVMSASLTYFLLTAISFPFLALFQAGSAFYRAGRNSRFPMTVSVISNLMNIVGNSIFIFGFGWGVFGAALSTLLSRIFSAAVVIVCLHFPKQPIILKDIFRIRPDWDMIRRILSIGIPSGIENGMFQFGKLAIQSSVSTLGTAAIAAQAMTIILENLNGIACIGIGIGLMTVVGQTLGAGRTEEAKYYIVHLTAVSELVLLISVGVVFILTKPVTWIAGMEPASARMCFQMVCFISVVKPIVWTLGFIPAYGLRAAGDVRFSMILSSLTMWLCRVFLATILIRVFHFGPIAVWIGMACDWTLRGIFYSIRYFSGKWLKHTVI